MLIGTHENETKEDLVSDGTCAIRVYQQLLFAYWEECHSVKQTAEHFGLSPNTLKTRIRREGWNQ